MPVLPNPRHERFAQELAKGKSADAAYVAPFIYAALIFAALYDVLLFGDWPDAISRVGMGVIVLGGVLMALRGGPQRN